MTSGQDSVEGGSFAAGRSARILRRAYLFLVSPKLAIAILVVVLACCITGVTVFRGARAGEVIFATLWFNALLALLAVSSAAAFFSRTWKRKLTLVSAGMIVFHLSFAAMLGGVVYNRLFFFDGSLRLTEGETLPNGRMESYDRVDRGRFFDVSTLRGETTLIKMHVNYRVNGENKRAAYEVAVSDGDALVRRIIYVAQHLDFAGVRYFCQKEGYSVLLVMNEKDGRENFGVHVPLQSLRQPDGTFTYATGTSEGIAPIPFPTPPEHPRAGVEMRFRPSTVAEREGEVTFRVLPLAPPSEKAGERAGMVPVRGRFDAGGFTLEPREIRYWVGMNVRYDPGLMVILTSLTLGLAGMIVIFVGRVRQGTARRRAAPERGQPAAGAAARTEIS